MTMDPISFEEIINEKTSEILMHYGIPKMQWGVRRFQNKDGSLTEEGKIRYASANSKHVKERKATYRNAKNMSDEEIQKKLRRYQLEDQLYDEVVKAQKHYPFTYQQIQQITDEMQKNVNKIEKASSSGKKILKVFKKTDKNKNGVKEEKSIEEFVDELIDKLEERDMLK